VARAAASQPASRPASGTDFAAEAALLFRVAACGKTTDLPDHLSRRLVKGHCKEMRGYMIRHRKRIVSTAGPFLARLRPANLPRKVVYPFGGGDLLFALTTFPDAEEITTISLERSGSVLVGERLRAGKVSRGELRRLLHDVVWMFMRLASVDYNFTTHMTLMEARAMPMQLSLALCALALHGFEPVSLRYFRLRPDGTLRYLDRQELDRGIEQHRLRAEQALAAAQVSPDTGRASERRALLRRARRIAATAPEVFANMELMYRRPGQPPRVYRHIAFNLDDSHLTADPSLLRHLEAKGRIAAMTKAASYLLWRDDFSRFRGYLLDHMEWMVSDSTGILPMHARPAGFEQEAFGKFRGAILLTMPERARDMLKLWRRRSVRPVPFTFGYPDRKDRSPHLLVTRRAGKT